MDLQYCRFRSPPIDNMPACTNFLCMVTEATVFLRYTSDPH